MSRMSHVVPQMASKESPDEMHSEDANNTDALTHDPGSPDSSSKKRKVGDAPSQRRKRATTACRFCRLRKTKCDNVRPVCGFCQFHQAKCVYSDSVSEEGASLNSKSDVQHHQLLQRLERIEELLRHPADNSEVGPEREGPPNLGGGSASPSPSSSKTRIFFSPSTRCEAPLRWPIFQDYIDRRYTYVNSFLLEPLIPEAWGTPRSNVISSPASSLSTHCGSAADENGGIAGETLVPLCRKFLVHVHTRNPILDSRELMAAAARCAEHGLKWDAPSCLVVRIPGLPPRVQRHPLIFVLTISSLPRVADRLRIGVLYRPMDSALDRGRLARYRSHVGGLCQASIGR